MLSFGVQARVTFIACRAGAQEAVDLGSDPSVLLVRGAHFRRRLASAVVASVKSDASGVNKLARDEHVWRNRGEFESFGGWRSEQLRREPRRICCATRPRSGFTMLPPPASLLPFRSAASVAPVTKGGENAPGTLVQLGCRMASTGHLAMAAHCGAGRRGRVPRLRRKDFCAQMNNYGRNSRNLSGLAAADGSDLAHRVPRPLKERAGALWLARKLRADDQVWRNVGEFESSRWFSK